MENTSIKQFKRTQFLEVAKIMLGLIIGFLKLFKAITAKLHNFGYNQNIRGRSDQFRKYRTFFMGNIGHI